MRATPQSRAGELPADRDSRSLVPAILQTSACVRGGPRRFSPCLRIVCTMGAGVGDDGPVVDKGCLVGAADLLALGGGPLLALGGAAGSLGAACLALAVFRDSTTAAWFAVLAVWCAGCAWFTRRFGSR